MNDIDKNDIDKIKLICFDLDETLITHTSWKELGVALGVSYEKDKELFKEYNSGKITYEEWNNRAIALYMKHPDANRNSITNILSKYTYTEGAREVVNYLKEKGYKLAIISGSIDILVDIVAKDLGIEFAKANNTLVFDEDDRLCGVETEGKDEILQKQSHLENFCKIINIDIDECACVADGANDIEMFRKTHHGITFKGSTIENEAWKIIGSLAGLRDIF